MVCHYCTLLSLALRCSLGLRSSVARNQRCHDRKKRSLRRKLFFSCLVLATLLLVTVVWEAFSTNFYPLKFKCLVTLFDRKHHASKTCQNWSFLAFFHGILSTQNVNVARFARKVECDFICDFQTPCYPKNYNFRKNELASRTTVFCGDCIRDDS